jgi:hypothetical protein
MQTKLGLHLLHYSDIWLMHPQPYEGILLLQTFADLVDRNIAQLQAAASAVDNTIDNHGHDLRIPLGLMAKQ